MQVDALRFQALAQYLVGASIDQRGIESLNHGVRSPCCRKIPYQVAYSKPGTPALAITGSPFRFDEFEGAVTPMAVINFFSIIPCMDGKLLNIACTSPPARSPIACDEPLYGT